MIVIGPPWSRLDPVPLAVAEDELPRPRDRCDTRDRARESAGKCALDVGHRRWPRGGTGGSFPRLGGDTRPAPGWRSWYT